jgi:glycosyltransferase involved in cell wall biosynthesis
MTSPSISVCVLNYNYGRYLRQAIDSALGQKTGRYTLAEILVIDDGSTDDSLQICATYHDRIRVVPRAHNGFPGTLTEAIRQARGDWVALLDADDWFAPDKLAVVAAAMTPACLLIQHREHVVKADGSPLIDRPHPGGNTSTITVRRDAALDLLPVTNELFFHVLDHLGHGVKLTEPLTCYRVHDSNMTARSTPGTQHDYMHQVNTEVAARLRDMAKSPPTWARAEALLRLSWHFTAAASGHTREAAIQRGLRYPAIKAASTGLLQALTARRDTANHLSGLRSAAISRPAFKTASANRPGARA